MVRPEIRMHIACKKQIAQEFDVTLQSVYMSLKYIFNSEKAKSIRKRAIEILKEEVKKAEELELQELSN